MKYTIEIDINKPRAEVVEKFDNAENLKKWQPELQSYEHLSGEPGKPGAQAKLKYKMGKREIAMIETIMRNDLPDYFEGTYEASGALNIMKNEFHDLGDKTKWVSHHEFKLRGFMKLIGFLFPGGFKKQSMKFAQQFKDFAEYD